MSDKLPHPSYYGGEDDPYEAIKVIEAWKLNFNLGNLLKYVSRHSKKGTPLKDLRKAHWYLEREIEQFDKTPEGATAGFTIPPAPPSAGAEILAGMSGGTGTTRTFIGDGALSDEKNWTPASPVNEPPEYPAEACGVQQRMSKFICGCGEPCIDNGYPVKQFCPSCKHYCGYPLSLSKPTPTAEPEAA